MPKTPSSRTSLRISRRSLTTFAVLTTGVALLSAVAPSGVSGASSSPTTIAVSQNKTWGATLTLKNGDTVYRLTADSKNTSVCTAKCATIWLPVVLAKGQKKPVGEGVSSLGSFTRSGGAKQVTYQGIPLYMFSKDKKPGQVNGNVKNSWGQWYPINPKNPLTPPKKSSGSSGTTTTAGGGIAY